MAQKLTARFIATVKAGVYADLQCPTLYLRVNPPSNNGRVSRQWRQRLQIDGKQSWLGLGGYPVVTIDEARDKTIDNRRTVHKGGDPRSHQCSDAPAFEEAVGAVIAIHSPGWRDGGKTAKLWRATLEKYAYPRLGAKRVDRITAADVMAVLNPIWHKKPETAKKVRQRISTVMNWAIAQGHREDNPAGKAISAALPKRNAVTEHLRALPFAEVGSAVTLISGLDRAALATRLAFHFLVLTAARSKEVRGARWVEVDFDGVVWTVPADRMKGGRSHRVPLSDKAIGVLREAQSIVDSSGLVFPSATGRVMSDNTLSKLLRENGVKAVPHGFRSSFRDWAAECTDAPREVCELALAHVEGSATERAYRRTDLFERRRELMQEWADYLTKVTD